jgi:hypothetical protein
MSRSNGLLFHFSKALSHRSKRRTEVTLNHPGNEFRKLVHRSLRRLLYGRILAEESARSDGALVTMLATVPLRHGSTLYQQWGDWFAWLDLAALAALLAFWSNTWKF